MPNEYSVSLHNHISEKIIAARQGMEKAKETGDHTLESYNRGQLDELHWLRRYLSTNIDLKNYTYY